MVDQQSRPQIAASPRSRVPAKGEGRRRAGARMSRRSALRAGIGAGGRNGRCARVGHERAMGAARRGGRTVALSRCGSCEIARTRPGRRGFASTARRPPGVTQDRAGASPTRGRSPGGQRCASRPSGVVTAQPSSPSCSACFSEPNWAAAQGTDAAACRRAGAQGQGCWPGAGRANATVQSARVQARGRSTGGLFPAWRSGRWRPSDPRGAP